MKHFTKFASIFGIVAIAAVAFVPVAQASVFRAGDTVVIPVEERAAENLYLAGGSVTVLTVAQQDLVAAGGRILVTNQVYGDIMVAGGTVDILEAVRGDIRTVGGQVTIGGLVTGDVIVAGGSVTILPGAVIGGDLMVAGGLLDMRGKVSGETHIYAGEARINGFLAGPATIKVGEQVTFGPETVIGSTLAYTAAQEATIEEGARMGEQVTFTKHEMPLDRAGAAAALFAIITVLFVAKLLAMGLAAGVGVAVFPTTARALVTDTLNNFWIRALIGLAVAVVTPVLAILLMVTVVGFYIALMVWVLYALALLVAGIAMCVVVGALIAKLIVKEVRVTWQWALLGALVASIVGLVPFVGQLVVAVVYLASLGAVAAMLQRDVHNKR